VASKLQLGFTKRLSLRSVKFSPIDLRRTAKLNRHDRKPPTKIGRRIDDDVFGSPRSPGTLPPEVDRSNRSGFRHYPRRLA
jgi:hypothetical protein